MSVCGSVICINVLCFVDKRGCVGCECTWYCCNACIVCHPFGKVRELQLISRAVSETVHEGIWDTTNCTLYKTSRIILFSKVHSKQLAANPVLCTSKSPVKWDTKKLLRILILLLFPKILLCVSAVLIYLHFIVCSQNMIKYWWWVLSCTAMMSFMAWFRTVIASCWTICAKHSSVKSVARLKSHRWSLLMQLMMTGLGNANTTRMLVFISQSLTIFHITVLVYAHTHFCFASHFLLPQLRSGPPKVSKQTLRINLIIFQDVCFRHVAAFYYHSTL